MEKRTRTSSYEQFFGDDETTTIEDMTAMKLMEEIVEIDQEIKMKQRWINSRMKMLHQLMPKQKKQGAKMIEKFMMQLQPEYPNKISVTYKREGENISNAIPMEMDKGEPIALGQADVYATPI